MIVELKSLQEQIRQLTAHSNEISLQNQYLILENAKLLANNRNLEYQIHLTTPALTNLG